MKRTVLIECGRCGGTGLYKGGRERDGAAVECFCCKGAGYVEYTFNEFEGRKELDNVTRVFKSSFGFIHSDKDMVTGDGIKLHYSEYGCSYEDWKEGAKPRPMEELYCPCIFVNKHYVCSRCQDGYKPLMPIATCKFYLDKAKCWEEWHEKND